MMMQNETHQHTFIHAEVDMMLVGKARNELVKISNSVKADVMWFIDDDVLISSDAGKLVDEALQLGIVGGLYCNRRPPYTPQAYRRATEPEYAGTNQLYWPILDYPEGLMVVDALGAGCLAIRADVFRKMEEVQAEALEQRSRDMKSLTSILSMLDDSPRHQALKIVQNLSNHVRRLSPWFEFLDEKGEDLYFCEQARDAGFAIWWDTTVKCMHLGYTPITEANFKWMHQQGLIRRMGPDGKPLD